ncbi:MAG: GAF domain-containing protein [Anaerolineae bacterium]|nr:GAF domain-containing protein [Anaerolineae bacterium]
MDNLGIAQKLLLIVVIVFILFTAVIYTVSVSTGYQNLYQVKQADLNRMSGILARRIRVLEQGSATVLRTLEENKPVVQELQLLTNYGPYYADPGSYFGADYMQSGVQIEDADKIYAFQAQLNLVQLLDSVRRSNNLSAISFYIVSPFDMVAEAKPVLALRLDEAYIYVGAFSQKGLPQAYECYRIPTNKFKPPEPDYFDISTAYSVSPGEIYQENNFELLTAEIRGAISEFSFQESFEWSATSVPQSKILTLTGNIPVIQSWFPLEVEMADPETWELTSVPVGVAVVEQRLDSTVIAEIREQFGLDVGLATLDRLLITSLPVTAGSSYNRLHDVVPSSESGSTYGTVTLQDVDFYYSHQPIGFSTTVDDSLPLAGVVFSPISELDALVGTLRGRIGFWAIVLALITGIIVYFIIQYLINRPLHGLMQGVQLIAAGDLTQAVAVQSRDELGQLAGAFNTMAAQLKNLIGSLEQRVADRTQDLERRAQQLRAVADVGRAVTSIRDLDKLLSQVTYLISDRFAIYHVGIFLLDSTGEYAVLRAANSEGGQQMLANQHRLRVGEQGIVGYVTRKGKARIALDVGDDAVHFENPFLPYTRSEMALPLMAGEHILGALDVQSMEEAAFTPDDIAVLQVLADQIAVAIENTRLFADLQDALEGERRAYGERSRQAWRDLLRTRGSWGYSYTHKTFADASGSTLAMQQAVQTGQTVRDISGETAVLSIPVAVRGQVLGVLTFSKEKPGEQWSQDEIDLLGMLTEQLAVALESARLYQQTQRREAFERFTREAAERMRETLDMEMVLQTAVEEIGTVLGLHDVMIELDMDASKGQLRDRSK